MGRRVRCPETKFFCKARGEGRGAAFHHTRLFGSPHLNKEGWATLKNSSSFTLLSGTRLLLRKLPMQRYNVTILALSSKAHGKESNFGAKGSVLTVPGSRSLTSKDASRTH